MRCWRWEPFVRNLFRLQFALIAAVAFGAALAWARARAPAPVPADISSLERAELEALVAQEEP